MSIFRQPFQEPDIHPFPYWTAVPVIRIHVNLADAIRRAIERVKSANGRHFVIRILIGPIAGHRRQQDRPRRQ